MTRTYAISGITCSGCVATIKHKLFLNPHISGVEILNSGSASITMHHAMSVAELQQIIGEDSGYRITEQQAGTETPAEKVQSAKSWFETYKPLLLIAGYIAGVSILLSNGSLHVGMNYFMAGFFLVFSFFKFLDLKGFAESYAHYDLLAMRVRVYGLIYPFIELALGAAYATGFRHLLTNWVTFIVMGFSSIGVIRSVLSKQTIRCACLGNIFELPMTTVTIVEDLVMVAMAAYMIFTI